MAGKSYSLKPAAVPKVNTEYRRIKTKIPAPQSIKILAKLRENEPVSMAGQPLVVWDRAEGCQVYDRWGNMWLDWSSGVLVTNAGHGRKEITRAVCDQARHGLHHNYCFPSEIRAKLAERLVKITPKTFGKAFILTTGSEATECAVKLARTYGRKIGGKRKIGIVSFQKAFHGRTLGSQMIGGSPALKEWIVNLDPAMWQVPFPDGYWVEDTSFDLFLETLKAQKVTPGMVAGVITETYQGGGASFAPRKYMQELSRWCKKHKIVLILDEVQAGFGRTGKLFGFEHYGITPDLMCCGKGITSGMPLSAVIGRTDLMDQYPPGSMTSTHTGNPICCAAALTSIDIILKEKLYENAAAMGAILHAELKKLQKQYPEVIGSVQGKGLVAAMHMTKPGKKVADYDLAFEVVRRCVEKGLLFFSPVGDSSIKIAPPLTINKAQVLDGCGVIAEALREVMSAEW